MSVEMIPKERRLLWTVKEFAQRLGVKESQARAFIAGEFPPPTVMVNERQTMVVASEIDSWLLEFSAWQREQARANARPVPTWGGDAA